ncbi:MAG: hypothetical protein HY000_17020 [Planctomycetes bacterium]|nr:hypothetical protein [Planctomycetota bacterium]
MDGYCRWDASGGDTTGLYDHVTATFYLRNANTTGAADVTFNFGPGDNNWIPIAGNWDATGGDTTGLYNPAAAQYHLRNSNTSGGGQIVFTYGGASNGWQPIAGGLGRRR